MYKVEATSFTVKIKQLEPCVRIYFYSTTTPVL